MGAIGTKKAIELIKLEAIYAPLEDDLKIVNLEDKAEKFEAWLSRIKKGSPQYYLHYWLR